jgi:hypothetical protein
VTSILEGLNALRASVRKTIWHKPTRDDMLRGMDMCIEFVEAHADAPLRKPQPPSKLDELTPASRVDTSPLDAPPPPRTRMPVDFAAFTGLEIIGEMTREQLISEIVHNWLGQLKDHDINRLRRYIVKYRSDASRKRMMHQAGLHSFGGDGFLRGLLGGYDDDDF